jgi:hypothetical protein
MAFAFILGACSSESVMGPGPSSPPSKAQGSPDSTKSDPTKPDSTTTDSSSTHPSPSPQAGYFAAPAGSSSGDGSRLNPWDLATALADTKKILQPGDTLWLLGGTYRGSFTSKLSGVAGKPIVVRQLPGQRAVLDAAGAPGSGLEVRGDHSTFWGFEVTNSNPSRVSASTGNHDRPNAVVNNASNTKYIHLTIHDGGVAFYSYPSTRDVEVYGTIAYNNGWQGPDRGHGHALYVKSNFGPVVLRDNVLFNQFGYGVHLYSNAGSGQLINIRLEGNIAFNNGTSAVGSTSANILVGGAAYADNVVLENNYTYFAPGLAGTNVKLGYGTYQNGAIRAAGNYFVGGGTVLELGYWSTADLRQNTFAGTAAMYSLRNPQTGGILLEDNHAYRDPASTAWWLGGASHTWASWRIASGLGGSDSVRAGAPTSALVRVRARSYEPGRASILVYNWDRSGSAQVDLTGVVPPGSPFVVHNVQDLFGAPVASGTFGGGAVTLPLSGVPPPAPTGMASSPSPGTGTEFHVFVVSVTQ